MRKDITVAAGVRTSRGKNEARRMRGNGQIPAVVYGAFQDPVSIAVNPRDVLKIIRSSTGLNTIFNLAIDGGETTPVMVVDEQVDPIKGTLLHTDFKRIDLSKRLRVTVPVLTQGEPKGVKVQGGLLEVVTRAVEIECLPDDIPEHFTIDVTELLIGQARRAGDVALSGSMRLVSNPDSVIAHVVSLRAEAAATEAAPAEGAAPAAAATPAPEAAKKEAPAEKKK